MIDVLLATYRPNPDWLSAQVASIRCQKGVSIRLLQREDERGEGPGANFGALLRESTADYVAFSDQDDIWLPDKMAKSMARLRELEKAYGSDTPLAVFTDGLVTDARLAPFRGTVVSRQKVDVCKGLAFERLLMQNFIAGCSLLFNAALRRKAGLIPREAIFHDYWVILVAAAFGRIGFVDEPLYLYRQHSQNTVGATTADMSHFVRRGLEGVGAFRARLWQNVVQAQAFVSRFSAEAPASAVALAHFGDMSAFERRRAMIQHSLFKQGTLRNLALAAFV